jgi:hypothetical protein
LLREVKTDASEALLPLPVLCVTALAIRKKQQDADKSRAGDGWIDDGLIFTTRHGTRKTCATLLAALDVHPRGDAHPSAQQDRRHDGDLHRGPSEATVEALRKLSEQLAA